MSVVAAVCLVVLVVLVVPSSAATISRQQQQQPANVSTDDVENDSNNNIHPLLTNFARLEPFFVTMFGETVHSSSSSSDNTGSLIQTPSTRKSRPRRTWNLS